MTLKKPHNQQPQTDWTCTLRADQVPAGGKTVKLNANEAERASVAARLGVRSIEKLEAKIALTPRNSGNTLEIHGSLQADLTQDCVVTLEPVISNISDEFEAWYADYEQAASFSKAQHERKSRLEMEEQPIMEEREDPEPMTNGAVDLAELAIQYLSLSINPYPRSDLAEEQDNEEGMMSSDSPSAGASQGQGLKLNPFAALKNWRPQD